MECEYCTLKAETLMLYMDDNIAAFLPEKGIAAGQVTIMTREHFPILELVPDEVVGHIFAIANVLTMVIFDALGAQGTNIIVQNGVPAGQIVPHFAVQLIPRNENDGIDFTWQPKQMAEEDLEKFKVSIAKEMNTLSEAQIQPALVREPETTKKISDNKENYMLKHLKKIP
tara:strand:- start:228 stop:740 length:513 start_codon:yes stop_codon:yes gene_type:complete